MLLVTGGAGFIGANFVLARLAASAEPVVNLDKLTYAGNLGNLASVAGDARHIFVRGDIADGVLVKDLLARHRPRAILNFAAETHVDRSIHGPAAFVQTNFVGTACLLEEACAYWRGLEAGARNAFRFVQVSTDEVYGTLGPHDPPFTEETACAPSSPYSASKAGADHLVRSYHRTYGLPAMVTRASNNYGPFQFPEKLLPLMIRNALAAEPLPVYGDGRQVRDWLHVSDHCAAIDAVLERGLPGETYNVGGECEKENLDTVKALCAVLDRLRPRAAGPHAGLIAHVADRPGHDRRYAVDTGKIRRELGWKPATAFDRGLESTVAWYLANPAWVQSVQTGAYRDWIDLQYAKRGAA